MRETGTSAKVDKKQMQQRNRMIFGGDGGGVIMSIIPSSISNNVPSPFHIEARKL
jgi:hypothetical protein